MNIHVGRCRSQVGQARDKEAEVRDYLAGQGADPAEAEMMLNASAWHWAIAVIHLLRWAE